MKFHCPLTKICTLTPERMRLHMKGDFYARMAGNAPGWEDSTDRKEFLQDLEEAEALEGQHKRTRGAIGTAKIAPASSSHGTT
mmetsp:Transcript_13857/g.39446  ORF Transcript_13857/g.39446 Transcript_13857/m.39446 type:complete len:83 (-) Transcript_13857:412-660(-)